MVESEHETEIKREPKRSKLCMRDQSRKRILVVF